MNFKTIIPLLFLVAYSSARSNDNFVNAVSLQGSFDQEFGDTIGSSQEAGEPSVNSSYGGGIWYRYTTGPSIYDMAVSVEVFNNTGIYDHALDVFKATGAGSIYEVVFVNGLRIDGASVATKRFVGSPNSTYYFRISHWVVGPGSPVEITLSARARPGTTPAALKANARNSLRKAIRKATSNLRAAQRRDNSSSAANIRQNIKKLKRELRRI